MLNQKVSLLLIIHNATNSRGLSGPPASLNILAAMQRRRKRGEREQFTHNYHSGTSRRLFGLQYQQRGGGFRKIDNNGKHAAGLEASGRRRGLRTNRRGNHASRRLLLHPGIRQKCSGSRCLEERGASEIQEEEGEGEVVVVVAEVGTEG